MGCLLWHVPRPGSLGNLQLLLLWTAVCKARYEDTLHLTITTVKKRTEENDEEVVGLRLVTTSLKGNDGEEIESLLNNYWEGNDGKEIENLLTNNYLEENNGEEI